jgi:phosphoribosylformylglycinamidine synthase PurS subunit
VFLVSPSFYQSVDTVGWGGILDSQSLAKQVVAKYSAQIYVTLRPSVLDPAGTAVQSGLEHMGYGNVDRVRIGKYIELTLEADDEASASQQLDRMCDQLLANPVIENYRFELMTQTAAVW